MTAILELKNVSYQYPLEKVNVIESVSLKLEEGKVYGLIGANDAGKTTLCTILRGFIPTLYKGTLTGEVQVLGKPIAIILAN
ncbi:ATP-binding cassette domain-containing protein [Enterococcus faecalis]|uniref:ATP-binding cassette domain-containing protein n=1 Tax=Enterococcus faecalis TaxID=1351 RepID=UPI0020A7C9EE|nr:ATP-binding cassette domain-containing protein [Enterococcus faecalis]MDT2220457.1 ATP-binding cassette domain-containing protein [Enterococcus faecalis]MDV7792959.1 ATP-binding cassette domain-containing protein [Enterococcus faecalis]MDV7821347.1 ATP-binding cassette domain-containing protein [Enterococcus faecalis]